MEIINCGVKVNIKLPQITGEITGVVIRYGSIQYEVTYFNEGEIYSIWLNENQFEYKHFNGTTKKIGYK